MAHERDKESGDAAGTVCPACDRDADLPYWCEVCERRVPEKRCPFCGLKAKKIR